MQMPLAWKNALDSVCPEIWPTFNMSGESKEDAK